MTYRVSVGQIVAMKPEQRTRCIAALPQSSRIKLAHLASLGIRRELAKVTEYQSVLEALTGDLDA